MTDQLLIKAASCIESWSLYESSGEPFLRCNICDTPADDELGPQHTDECFVTRLRTAASSQPMVESFQARLRPWMLKCFGPVISFDKTERNHRFFEEAAELVQALGMTASECHQLVDYTFARPIGEATQEVGGTVVTLAALCLANDMDMAECGEAELARINVPATIEKIRAKHATKPKHSPLPEAVAQPMADSGIEPMCALPDDPGNADEIQWLHRLLTWSRARLKRPEYQETLDRYIAEGTRPVDAARLVHSAPPPPGETPVPQTAREE